MKNLYAALLMCTTLLLLSACTPEATRVEPASSETYFPISIGGSVLHVQLALTPNEHRRGLMYRHSMAEDHGMLFLFRQPAPRSFWMRNTHIPLDLAYFDASGGLLEIHALYPYDENGVASRNQQVLIAVETNRGWFARKQIKPGAQLDLNALQQAVQHRGQSLGSIPFRPVH